jgi:ABC-2 type transport system ATP-binding protein
VVFGHPRTAGDLRRIGYLPEERGLYRKMTVMDQLVFFGEIRGLRGPGLIADIQRWLERVDLAKWAKSKIEELSKGMQQKVQLIGTVLHTPDLLILDEPFSGLDPINQELFRELLLDYRSQGKSVVLSTHGMELAERMCDHICLISRGRAVLDGELKAIKRRIGGNAFRLVADGDLERLREMPEVEQAIVQDGVAKLMLRPDVQGAAVLRQLVGFLNVHEFRSEEPELEQIFLKVVNDAA